MVELFQSWLIELADTLKAWFVWLVSEVAAFGEWVVAQAASGLTYAGVPDSYLATIGSHASQWNYVLPLYEVVGMATAFFGLWLAVLGIKAVFKIIPGL